MRMPSRVNDNLVMGLELLVDLARLVIPDPHVALRVSRGEVPSIGREGWLTGVSSHHVSRKQFLAVLADSILSVVDVDLVIHRLTCQPFFYFVQTENYMLVIIFLHSA